MNESLDRLTTAGGGIGGVTAYLLNIHPMQQIIQVALCALIGSVVGESVKEGIKYLKKRRLEKYGK